MVKNWPGHWSGMWLNAVLCYKYSWISIVRTKGDISGRLCINAQSYTYNSHLVLTQALKAKYANVYDDMSSHQNQLQDCGWRNVWFFSFFLFPSHSVKSHFMCPVVKNNLRLWKVPSYYIKLNLISENCLLILEILQRACPNHVA